jgi:hypothetical protein
MPVKACPYYDTRPGIQKGVCHLSDKDIWIPGRATLDCDPELPGMMLELLNGFGKQDTTFLLQKFI